MSAIPKPKVYVADDDVGVLSSLQFLLETDGFDVRTFRSGTALLNALDHAPIDCFVIDYKMPDMNGVDLTHDLRRRGATAPVVLITGHYDDKLAARAAAAGVYDFLLKPLLDENLVKRVRTAIAERQIDTDPGPAA